MLFGIDTLAQWGILLIIDYLVEECVHKDDDLYIFLYGFLEDVRLGLEYWITLFVFRLEEMRICRE
jgi:hypothetical protein